MQALNRGIAVVLLLVGTWVGLNSTQAWSEDTVSRKVKNKVEPSYPELAKRMNIVGVVKVQVTVLPNGSVKDAKVVGGHPVLVNAALDAARKWRFETAAQESTGVLEFHFDGGQ